MPCVLYSKHDSQVHNFQVGVVWNKYIVMVADMLMFPQFKVFPNVTSMPNAKEKPAGIHRNSGGLYTWTTPILWQERKE
ncbi:hypothetical protein D5270_09205 [Acutalibacter sp. 1XD8-36]|nr:hypothetical protein [Acutalibacter sp. 1XD8-36]